MFDKLEDLVDRLDTLNNQLTDPDIVSDQNKFRKLMKEQSELTPIVEKYKEYKDAKQTIEDSLLMLEEENDEELREMAKEELNEAKATVEKTENELKILLLPKDPNDSKNVIVEIRAGAGGDEAALFAYEIYRMYQKYVDQFKWKSQAQPDQRRHIVPRREHGSGNAQRVQVSSKAGGFGLAGGHDA